MKSGHVIFDTFKRTDMQTRSPQYFTTYRRKTYQEFKSYLAEK